MNTRGFIRRVDPDSQLSNDMIQLKEKEGKDHILLNFTYKVNIAIPFTLNTVVVKMAFALIVNYGT